MKFRKYLAENKALDDLFNFKHSPVIKKEVKVVPYSLTLYRGFDADLNSLKQDEQFYYLSPERSEQGQMWFAHAFINAYNPLQYAKNHGSLLLTYPLDVKKHIQVNHSQDGKSHNSVPDYFNELSVPTENCRYYAGIELPDGWIFSYKMEKFIGCSLKLKVPKNSIVPVQED